MYMYIQVSNLLADIGGQLGLWIGISVITLAEFIQLGVELGALVVSKQRQGGKKQPSVSPRADNNPTPGRLTPIGGV